MLVKLNFIIKPNETDFLHFKIYLRNAIIIYILHRNLWVGIYKKFTFVSSITNIILIFLLESTYIRMLLILDIVQLFFLNTEIPSSLLVSKNCLCSHAQINETALILESTFLYWVFQTNRLKHNKKN